MHATKTGVSIGLGLGVCLGAGLLATYALSRTTDLPTVPSVDLDRYMGDWYEIAALPRWFERGCTDTRATYQLNKDGTIAVINSCVRNGKATSMHGTAAALAPETQARLKVTFHWPFSGDYWILALDPDYQYALVGAPDRRSLWILARTPSLSLDIVDELLEYAATLGFAVGAMRWTKQTPALRPAGIVLH